MCYNLLINGHHIAIHASFTPAWIYYYTTIGVTAATCAVAIVAVVISYLKLILPFLGIVLSLDIV